MREILLWASVIYRRKEIKNRQWLWSKSRLSKNLRRKKVREYLISGGVKLLALRRILTKVDRKKFNRKLHKSESIATSLSNLNYHEKLNRLGDLI